MSRVADKSIGTPGRAKKEPKKAAAIKKAVVAKVGEARSASGVKVGVKAPVKKAVEKLVKKNVLTIKKVALKKSAKKVVKKAANKTARKAAPVSYAEETARYSRASDSPRLYWVSSTVPPPPSRKKK